MTFVLKEQINKQQIIDFITLCFPSLITASSLCCTSRINILSIVQLSACTTSFNVCEKPRISCHRPWNVYFLTSAAGSVMDHFTSHLYCVPFTNTSGSYYTLCKHSVVVSSRKFLIAPTNDFLDSKQIRQPLTGKYDTIIVLLVTWTTVCFILCLMCLAIRKIFFVLCCFVVLTVAYLWR